ncbi:hypothetical protein ACU8KH_05713 [Lachancea thermotolerans]
MIQNVSSRSFMCYVLTHYSGNANKGAQPPNSGRNDAALNASDSIRAGPERPVYGALSYWPHVTASRLGAYHYTEHLISRVTRLVSFFTIIGQRCPTFRFIWDIDPFEAE